MIRTLSTTTPANWKSNPSGIGSLIVSSVIGTLVPQPPRERNAMGALPALTTVWALGSTHAKGTGVEACVTVEIKRAARNSAAVAVREHCFWMDRSNFIVLLSPRIPGAWNRRPGIARFICGTRHMRCRMLARDPLWRIMNAHFDLNY